MVRNRLGKIFIPIEEIPRAITLLANQKNINLNLHFELTLQSSVNPELVITKIYRNFQHLKHYVDITVDNTSDNPKYGLKQFKSDGVMDNVRIVSLKQVNGGCSKHTVKKHERVFSNHIYKFNVISQVSLHNNCGIQCLRQIVPMDGSPEDIRRKYKITLKTKRTFEELNHIYINEIKDDYRPLILSQNKQRER